MFNSVCFLNDYWFRYLASETEQYFQASSLVMQVVLTCFDLPALTGFVLSHNFFRFQYCTVNSHKNIPLF